MCQGLYRYCTRKLQPNHSFGQRHVGRPCFLRGTGQSRRLSRVCIEIGHSLAELSYGSWAERQKQMYTRYSFDREPGEVGAETQSTPSWNEVEPDWGLSMWNSTVSLLGEGNIEWHHNVRCPTYLISNLCTSYALRDWLSFFWRDKGQSRQDAVADSWLLSIN